MPEAREEDEVEQAPIPLKNVSPAIPKSESELKELIEDLTRMGYKGLLTKPWNPQSEVISREFLFEGENQWFRTIWQDPKKWTAEVWAMVYGFSPRKGKGWATCKDNFYIGQLRGEHDPKDRFHLGNYLNHKEGRVVEFILPILSLEKPKQLNITMENTLF
jgi:hypothetical protein